MRLKDFFYLRFSDRQALLLLMALVAVVSLLLLLFHSGDELTSLGASDSIRVERRDSVWYRSGYQHRPITYAVDNGRRVARFPFDPNTADSTALLQLGLAPWQVRSIYRYRAKGGVFRQPSDFAKVYGLTKQQYRELEPYIVIGDAHHPAAELFESTMSMAHDTARHHSPKLRPSEQIDLNTSDTTMLMRVPGIGSYFARSIEHYRQRLGGFYDVRQLMEIIDFPQEALRYFEIKTPVNKLRVNQLSLNELKRHSYINFYQARDIVNYRRMRGPLKDIRDLKLLEDFTEADFERLCHYLSYE